MNNWSSKALLFLSAKYICKYAVSYSTEPLPPLQTSAKIHQDVHNYEKQPRTSFILSYTYLYELFRRYLRLELQGSSQIWVFRQRDPA